MAFLKRGIFYFFVIMLAVVSTASANTEEKIIEFDKDSEIKSNELGLVSRIREELPPPKLTKEEWQWLNHKRVIKLGIAAPNYPPFDITSGLHDYDGINADYLGLIAHNLNNIDVRVFHYATNAHLLKALRKGEVDLIANASDFEQKQSDLLLSRAYVASKPAIVERKDGIQKKKNQTIRVAIEHSYSQNDYYMKIFPNAEYTIYDSSRRALDLLSFNKLDVFIGDSTTARYLINQGNLNNLELRNLPSNENSTGFAFAALKSNEPLIHVIDKVLENIPDSTKDDIQRRWTGGTQISLNDNRALLTMLEKKWIENNKVVRVAVNNDIPPLSFFDVNGHFQGITADLLETITIQTNLRFEIVSSDSLQQAIDKVKQDRADIVVGVTLDAIWSNRMLTTRAYLFNSWVMVGKPEQEKMNTIALVKGHPLESFVKHNYPNSELVIFNTTMEGLNAVDQGRVDGFIIPMLSADFLLPRHYRDRLTVINSLNISPARFVIGVSNNKYPLTTILDKALLNIPPEDIHALTSKWYINTNLVETTGLSLSLSKKNNAMVFYGIMIFLGLLLILFFILNKFARQRLAQLRERQHALLDAIPLPIYLTDFNQKIIFANKSFLKSMELTTRQVEDSTLLDYKLNLDAGNAISLNQFTHSDHHQALFVTRQLMIHGEERTLHQWSVIYTSEDHQHAYGNVGGWIDITEREKLIEELQEAKEIADNASRTKTSFLATMSHEIRTPMNAIIGMLELVLQRKPREPDWNALQIAHDSAYSLLALIGDILDIAKIESDRMVLHPERANLRHLLESVTMIFEGQARQKGLEFQLEMDSRATGDILVDPMRFKQILSNLISNAIKFTDTGQVTLRVSADDELQERLNLTIDVIDTGIGVDEQTKMHLFEPFAQGNSGKRSAGTGLGLYICKTLITMMGGSISFTSQLGIGTEITIHLSVPKLVKIDMIDKPVVPEPKIDCTRKLTILIVEDNKAGRLLLSQQLHFLGHHVLSNENGKEALETLQERRVDLIITDCNMPHMDGYTLTRTIRKQEHEQNRPTMTIWGLTADIQNEAKERCLAVGMNDCLFKPVGLSRLSDKIEKLSQTLYPDGCETEEAPESNRHFKQENLPKEIAASPEMYLNFIQIMIESLTEDNESLNHCVSKPDFPADDVKQLAHKILGGVRLIKAEEVIALCQHVQNEPNAASVTLLYETVQQLISELTAYLQTKQPI